MSNRPTPVNVLDIMERDADDADECRTSHDGLDANVTTAALGESRVARAAVAELIESLKPLAQLDLTPDGFDKRPDDQIVYQRNSSTITVGDVRRAAAALARCRGGDQP